MNIVQTYIVRVYHANSADGRSVSGVIEDIDSGQQESFHSIEGLESLLAYSVMQGQLEIPDLVTHETGSYDNVVILG